MDFDGHLGFLVVISDMVEMFHLAAILVWTTLVNFGFVGLIRFTEIFDLSAVLALAAIPISRRLVAVCFGASVDHQ